MSELEEILEPEVISARARPVTTADVQIEGVDESDWGEVCAMLAQGVKIGPALADLFISQATYRLAMATNAELRKRIQAARAVWDDRRWPEERILQIFDMIGSGMSLAETAEALSFKAQHFHALRHRDPYVQETYDLALKIQAEGMVDEMRAIVDNLANDTIETEQGTRANGAAPQRDRLRFEMRKWAASKLLRQTYGEKLDVDMTHDVGGNLADRLSGARNRREAAHKARLEEIGEGQ